MQNEKRCRPIVPPDVPDFNQISSLSYNFIFSNFFKPYFFFSWSDLLIFVWKFHWMDDGKTPDSIIPHISLITNSTNEYMNFICKHFTTMTTNTNRMMNDFNHKNPLKQYQTNSIFIIHARNQTLLVAVAVFFFATWNSYFAVCQIWKMVHIFAVNTDELDSNNSEFESREFSVCLVFPLNWMKFINFSNCYVGWHLVFAYILMN